ncbi:MAG: hypothetical protein ACO3ND_06535 [Opitutales bacterium]
MPTRSAHHRDPSLTPRERSVLVIAAAVLVLVPWSWGGSVPWIPIQNSLSSGLSLMSIIDTEKVEPKSSGLSFWLRVEKSWVICGLVRHHTC